MRPVGDVFGPGKRGSVPGGVIFRSMAALQLYVVQKKEIVMKPSRENRVTLTDLLERVLDKGVILDADLLISIGGVPLIGVNLRAAIAGMDTMLKYGLMKQWDKEVRQTERIS